MNNFLILYSSYTHGKTSEDILLNLLQLVQKFISYKLLLCAAHMASFAKLVFFLFGTKTLSFIKQHRTRLFVEPAI